MIPEGLGATHLQAIYISMTSAGQDDNDTQTTGGEPYEDLPFVLVEKVVDPYVVGFHEPRGFRAEQIRSLRNKLLVMNPENAPRSLAITSALQGEGKTVTSINLSIAFAELEDHKVVLLDFDLRKPCVEPFLGLNPGPGLTELLMGGASLEDVLRPSGIDGLDIIGTGLQGVAPSELLQSRRIDELLSHLKQDYSYLLLDTPPALPITDAGALGRKCDGTLLVVGLEKSPRKLVKEALTNLEESGSNVLGCFVTGVRGADPAADARYRYPSMD
jgi:capsular exopolysaccharide synthesis family protein